MGMEHIPVIDSCIQLLVAGDAPRTQSALEWIPHRDPLLSV